MHEISIFNLLTPMSDQDRILSLQYQNNIKHTSYKNKEKYQFGGYKMIQY